MPSKPLIPSAVPPATQLPRAIRLQIMYALNAKQRFDVEDDEGRRIFVPEDLGDVEKQAVIYALDQGEAYTPPSRDMLEYTVKIPALGNKGLRDQIWQKIEDGQSIMQPHLGLLVLHNYVTPGTKVAIKNALTEGTPFHKARVQRSIGSWRLDLDGSPRPDLAERWAAGDDVVVNATSYAYQKDLESNPTGWLRVYTMLLKGGHGASATIGPRVGAKVSPKARRVSGGATSLDLSDEMSPQDVAVVVIPRGMSMEAVEHVLRSLILNYSVYGDGVCLPTKAMTDQQKRAAAHYVMHGGSIHQPLETF